jgi:NAD(P)-dependent dehydrogenase (short-subunit alcohol dehydrogenase family)
MKVAVVTGVARTSGIGHAICSALLDHGHAVIGFDKSPLEKSSNLPKHPHFRSNICRVDDNPGLLHELLHKSLGELGEKNVNVVVNNAGLANAYMPPQEENPSATTEDEILHRLELFDNYISNNLRSAFLVTEVCKPLFPDPIQTDTKTSVPNNLASIINIASTRALQSEFGPSRSQEGYASAKSGMIGLTHAQGQSLAGKARVNVILPGWVNTDDEYVPSQDDHAWHAAGRVGCPADIANMVVFLSDNEKSGFVTCQEFVIDGGCTKRMYYPD